MVTGSGGLCATSRARAPLPAPGRDLVREPLCFSRQVVITDVQLWVRNGLSSGGSAAFPRALSVWAGPYYNELTRVYGDTPLPAADDGACLTFPVPATLAAEEAPDGSCGPRLDPPPPDAAPVVSRVVHLQFSRDVAAPLAMILGRIAVNGVPPDAAVVPDSGVNAVADAAGLAALTLAAPATDSMVERKVPLPLPPVLTGHVSSLLPY